MCRAGTSIDTHPPRVPSEHRVSTRTVRSADAHTCPMRPLASFASTRSASAPISFDTRSTVAFCASSVPAPRAVGRRGLLHGVPKGDAVGSKPVPEGREHSDPSPTGSQGTPARRRTTSCRPCAAESQGVPQWAQAHGAPSGRAWSARVRRRGVQRTSLLVRVDDSVEHHAEPFEPPAAPAALERPWSTPGVPLDYP